MISAYADIKKASRIVVKVGTSTLARTLSDLHNSGKDVILVSSGAIGIALGKLGLSQKPDDTNTKQALAAVGQCELMYLYDKMFSEYNNTVAQILLTKDDI